VTKLQNGLSGIRIPVTARDFCLIEIVQIGFGAHLAYYSVGTGFNYRGLSSQSMRLSPHLHLLPRLWMNGLHYMHSYNFTY